MDMDAGVLDAPEAEIEEGLAEVDEGFEQEQQLETEVEQVEPKADDPYTTKFSREYRAALRELEQAHPEKASFLKAARDNHARMFALAQLEPKGIDGVRERYALLEAIGGSEGLTGLQERMAGVEELDSLLISANPEAYNKLPPEMMAGIAKSAGPLLDKIAEVNPEAFNSAILPHFVSALFGSELVKDLDSVIDILNVKDDPRLDDATKLKLMTGHIAKMAGWFQAQQQKAGSAKTAPVDAQRNEFDQERAKFEQERQDAHWKTSINPQIAAHENAKFEELFKPYQTRLKLDVGAKTDLQQSFKQGLSRAALNDAEFQRQLKIYKGQKNPDPVAVANYVKNAANKHAKTVMEALVKARYGSFLAGRPKTVTQTQRPGSTAPGVEIRTVRPAAEDVDDVAMRGRRDLVWQDKYILKSGKTVQYRPNA